MNVGQFRKSCWYPIRIALYAQRNHDEMKLYEPPRPIVEKLKTLLQLRKTLIISRNHLQVPCKELLAVDCQAGKEALKLIAPAVKALQKVLMLGEPEKFVYLIRATVPLITRSFI